MRTLYCNSRKASKRNKCKTENRSRPPFLLLYFLFSYSLSRVRKPGVLRKKAKTELVSTPRPTFTSIASSNSSQHRSRLPSTPAAESAAACASASRMTEGLLQNVCVCGSKGACVDMWTCERDNDKDKVKRVYYMVQRYTLNRV